MKKANKIAALVLAAAVTTTGLSVMAACDNGSGNGGGNSSDVAGTYSITYSTTDISGNVRHTGYLTAMQATETNTLVLKNDYTYEYTKYVTSNRDTSNTASAASYGLTALADEADENVLFSWTSAGDGNCTFTCYIDGTYEFVFTTMNMKEKGTWEWNNWTFKITKPDDSQITATMDGSNALNFHYVAVAGGGQLSHDFTCGSGVWGAAFGGKGDYTPVNTNLLFAWTSAGDGNCTLEFNKDGTYKFVYTTMSMTETGTWKWENWTMTLTQSDDTVINVTMDNDHALNVHYVAVAGGGQLYHDFTCGSDVWGAAFGGQGNYTPVESSGGNDSEDNDSSSVTYGPIIISYLFKGTYTNDGNTVTLNSATSCTWSEDWGPMVAQGFTNVSGNENDRVYPKGETGEWYLPLDHFSSKFYFAVNGATTVTNNYSVKVEINGNGTFDYVEESAFD